MNLGKKEGIVVVGEIQKREIMPLTLELIGAAGKLSKELMKSFVSKMKN